MSDNQPLPQLPCVRVHFTRIAEAQTHPEGQGVSYCASGYVFLGKLELVGADGSLLSELEVQTGGWMSTDSPFARQKLCPPNPTWGSYVPQEYPDTAFPLLSEPTVLGTLRTGRLRGFRVPDPPGTGRSWLMVHDSTRRGSEGCITTPPGELWEAFCAYMAQWHAEGRESIPLTVSYTCAPPNPLRCPHAAS